MLSGLARTGVEKFTAPSSYTQDGGQFVNDEVHIALLESI